MAPNRLEHGFLHATFGRGETKVLALKGVGVYLKLSFYLLLGQIRADFTKEKGTFTVTKQLARSPLKIIKDSLDASRLLFARFEKQETVVSKQ